MNTVEYSFKLSQKFPDFQDRIDEAKAWWDRHVVTGVSPKFNEYKDKDILRALRAGGTV